MESSLATVARAGDECERSAAVSLTLSKPVSPVAAIGRGAAGWAGVGVDGTAGVAGATPPDWAEAPADSGVSEDAALGPGPVSESAAGVPLQCGPCPAWGWSIRTKKTRRGGPAGGRGGSSSGEGALVMAIRSIGTTVTIR
jgi:hypothetical protein